MRLLIGRSARREIREAQDDYAAEGPTLAKDFALAVEHALTVIASAPTLCAHSHRRRQDLARRACRRPDGARVAGHGLVGFGRRAEAARALAGAERDDSCPDLGRALHGGPPVSRSARRGVRRERARLRLDAVAGGRCRFAFVYASEGSRSMAQQLDAALR